jgi:hypothetical protein
MNVTALVLATALAVLPPALAAQEPAAVRPNDRLRFAAPSAGFATPVAGTVIEVRDGELHVVLGRSADDPAGLLVVVPVRAVTSLERSGGRRSRLQYGLYGMGLGTGLGLLAGELHSRIEHRKVEYVDPTNVTTYSTEITIAGAAIGAVVGALLPGERWRPLGVTALSVDRTTARGTRVGLRLSF